MTTTNDITQKEIGILLGLSKTATAFITSEAAATNQLSKYHPGFLTFPDLEDHFGTAMETADSLLVGYIPRVEGRNNEAWVEYSSINQGWILDANNVTSGLQPIADSIWEQSEYVYEIDGNSPQTPVDPFGRAVMSPVWQFYPPPPVDETGFINRDMMSISSYETGLDFVSRTRKATYLDTRDFTRYFGIDPGNNTVQTAILFPVFGTFGKDSTIVGDLIAVFSWSTFFEGIFTETSPTVHVVISNTCNQTMTFEVDGRSATFLGEGDLHITKFSSMRETGTFAGFANSHDLLLDDEASDHCEYFQTVYPTQEFQDTYMSTTPMFTALIILGVFLLTAVAFIVSNMKEVETDCFSWQVFNESIVFSTQFFDFFSFVCSHRVLIALL
jgi:hypothetical protein